MSIEQEEIPAGAEVSILSKNEKKAKKLILKLGLKQITGISRVTFKKKGNFVFAIDRPEVYKSQGGAYVVFGECKVEDLNKRYQQAAAAAAAAEEGSAANANATGSEIPSKDPASITADLEASAALKENAKNEDDNDDDGEPVDETGLDSADIDIVVEQTNVSRKKAVKALKDHKGDMVNAIMSLSP
ncbi:hypothetical protein PACTADRAFT_50370 [Pachysolen tannophilus NRRL Y-2460]|uniref:Nascent polypeptide-associated complex subunit alpha n=1 Tax=Pachysolen tannophilus NRRL Y-2460 TaxID=669874 RepID=A0A1E4TV88_PACTA|nr:hypothetical protein PACTADRAFT_50370 [Pachysolen tannophilus NRRL Y-2460]